MDSFSDSLHNLEIKGLKREIHDRWLGSSNLLDLNKKPQKTQLGELIFSPLILIICSVVFLEQIIKA